MAEKTNLKQDEKGRDIPELSHGKVYTIAETICRVSHNDYDVVCQRIKLIANLLNTHGE
ncbi:MAG: hypothetical protein ACRYFR_14070 [Janthinobacterium lividum]